MKLLLLFKNKLFEIFHSQFRQMLYQFFVISNCHTFTIICIAMNIRERHYLLENHAKYQLFNQNFNNHWHVLDLQQAGIVRDPGNISLATVAAH